MCLTHDNSYTWSDQSKKESGQRRALGVLETLHIVAATHGLRGLYAGVDTKIAQTVLTNAFMFVVYEKLVWMTRLILMSGV